MSDSNKMPLVQNISSILWPSFMTSSAANALFFAAFDPLDLFPHMEYSRIAIYTVGFFSFWLLTASTCALTCYFRKPCASINKE